MGKAKNYKKKDETTEEKLEKVSNAEEVYGMDNIDTDELTEANAGLTEDNSEVMNDPVDEEQAEDNQAEDNTSIDQAPQQTEDVVVDPYKANAGLTEDDAYNVISKALTSNKSNDDKLEDVRKLGSPEYQQLVLVLDEYNTKLNTKSEFNVKASPEDYAAETMKLNDVIVSALADENYYSRVLKLDILVMVFKKYNLTSLTPLVFCKHMDAAKGTQTDIQNHIFNMTVLYRLSRADNIKEVLKDTGFKNKDFKYGSVFEEYIRQKRM